MTPISASLVAPHDGSKLVHAVEHDLAEGPVVLGEIVDRRRRGGRSGGQSGGTGAQSKSRPHSTLKENVTSASCGSNPFSASVTSKVSCAAAAASLTSCSV